MNDGIEQYAGKQFVVCSFCGKNQNEAVRIFVSPDQTAAICNSCVYICQDWDNKLADRKAESEERNRDKILNGHI